MIARMGSGWQVVLADLSMILFMITAAAVADAPPDPPDPPAKAAASAAPPGVPALAAPVALWRGGAGAPVLAEWLKSQPSDPRLRLTIVAPAREAATALALARGAGRPARIVLESDLGGPVLAALTYDQGSPLAQPLQPVAANSSDQEIKP